MTETTAIAARFAKFVALLDAAGLGPAYYSYSALKWRLQRPEAEGFDLTRALINACRTALFSPPCLAERLAQGSVLAASSYVVSANLLRKVMAELGPGVATLYDATKAPSPPLARGFAPTARALAMLAPALAFAFRVRSTLKRAGAPRVEADRIALAAFVHRTYRPVACAVLDEVRPRCLVIGNGNRHLEFALWAEAKARKLQTVLLPYAEINLKPERFLSLCRGNFDLALPFSDYSAAELRKLRADIACEVVGFPTGLAQEAVDGEADRTDAGKTVLYLAGTNFEEAASSFLKEAFDGCDDLCLRVRLHPRDRGPDARTRFDWLDDQYVSDPKKIALSTDIASANVALAIRSTAALDAMVAGIPFVWVSPQSCGDQLERNPVRSQELALFDAKTPAELRVVLRRILSEDAERKRVVEEQWSRLRAAGFGREYFNKVKSALFRLLGTAEQRRSGLAEPGRAPHKAGGATEGSFESAI